MVTVVLAVRVTDVEQRSLEAGRVALGQPNGQTEHARGNEGTVVGESTGHRATLVTDDEVRVRCTGPAQGKRNESGKSEQSGCNHVE